MKKLAQKIFILFVLAFVPYKTVFAAATSGSFTFSFGQQHFSAGAETISGWQGQQAVGANQILNPAPKSFQNSLLTFVGQTPPKQNLTLTYHYNLGAIYGYIQTLAEKIDVSAQEPILQIQNGRATQFTPPQTGVKIDIYQSALLALRALEMGNNASELTVYVTPPQTSLPQTNTLGINELVGEGVSNFAGSPNNRRHNIAVGIQKFQGLIIPQGQEFSFDDNLGPVTADAGFLPELVIKGKEGTIPELGGGLCQVSTTTFRAAMNAGLPITDRRNHAYAVSYYSPQGTDATIYPGSADLKFINNTPGAILIWPYEKDKNTLVFDFYGTNDGRQVTLQKPVVYDRLPDGSMKAYWTRIVTDNGKTATSTFKSVYQPPALFHKTETFVSSTGTPISGLKMPAKTQ